MWKHKFADLLCLFAEDLQRSDCCLTADYGGGGMGVINAWLYLEK